MRLLSPMDSRGPVINFLQGWTGKLKNDPGKKITYLPSFPKKENYAELLSTLTFSNCDHKMRLFESFPTSRQTLENSKKQQIAVRNTFFLQTGKRRIFGGNCRFYMYQIEIFLYMKIIQENQFFDYNFAMKRLQHEKKKSICAS